MAGSPGGAPWERYEWIYREDPEGEGLWVPDAFCVLVTRESPEVLLQVYHADPEPALTSGTWDDAESLWDDEPDDDESSTNIMQLLVIEGWTVAVEDNGFLGVQDEVAAALATSGRCAAFFQNVDAHMRVVLAEDGAVVRGFDPLLYWEDVGEPLPEERDLPFGDAEAEVVAAAFVMLERWTGLVLTGDALFGAAAAFHRYRLP